VSFRPPAFFISIRLFPGYRRCIALPARAAPPAEAARPNSQEQGSFFERKRRPAAGAKPGAGIEESRRPARAGAANRCLLCC